MDSSSDPQRDFHLDALLAEAGWLQALARRLARDQAEAEDIAQSTLALALERRPLVRDSLRPWLARVANRLARHGVRSDARRKNREALASAIRPAVEPGADEGLERFEQQQDLAKRVSSLLEPYRGVLIRRYYLNQSVKQIAAGNGTTPGTVRSQLGRGLDQLRAQYNDSSGRGSLGVFILAAGGGGSISRTTAEVAIMQLSTKKVVAVAAAALVLTAAYVGFNLVAPDAPRTEVALPQLSDLQLQDELESRLAADDHEGEAQRTVVESSAKTNRRMTAPIAEPPTATVSIIRARIIDENRRPLAGATLSSIHPDGRPRGKGNVAQSDGDGRVVLELNDQSMRKWRDDVFDMVFAVSGTDHATEFLIKQPRLHGDIDLGDVRLLPGGVLVGVCVDSEGRPIAGAVVYAGVGVLTDQLASSRTRGPSLGVARPRTTSADDGSFVLTGLEATRSDRSDASARLWAHAPGRLWTITEPFTITPRGHVDVGRIVLEEVPAELRIDGVVYGPDGLTAAGARVDFFSQGKPHYGHVVTDESGRFMIMVRGDEPMEIVARDPERKFGSSASLITQGGERAELLLRHRQTLVVQITDEAGNPRGDAHFMPVIAEDPESSAQDGRLFPGQQWMDTDADGRLVIDVPGQRFSVVARRAGSGTRTVGPFEPDSAPKSVTIALPNGPEVSGRVLAYGKPVAGAKVSAVRRHDDFAAMTGGFPNRYPSGVSSVVTDSEGHFVAPLKLRWSTIGVIARSEGFAVGEVQLDVQHGKGASGIEIHMTKGGTIEGDVLAPPGMVAAGLFVAASRGDGMPVSTIVDADGRYRLEGLTPGAWRVEGRLEAVRTEMVSISRHPDDLEPHWNASVADGETLELDIDAGYLGRVQVSGLLRIDGAAPPRGWMVEIVAPRHARGPTAIPAVEIGSNGRFSFSAPSLGRVNLRLVGTLPGGATVEMLREVQLIGTSFHWEDNLTTAPVLEPFAAGVVRARFVRADDGEPDREMTIVAVDESGILSARVPTGNSEVQVPADVVDSGEAWTTVRTLEVPR